MPRIWPQVWHYFAVKWKSFLLFRSEFQAYIDRNKIALTNHIIPIKRHFAGTIPFSCNNVTFRINVENSTGNSWSECLKFVARQYFAIIYNYAKFSAIFSVYWLHVGTTETKSIYHRQPKRVGSSMLANLILLSLSQVGPIKWNLLPLNWRISLL